MSDVFKIGPISVSSGRKGYGVLPVTRMACGFEINIPMHVIVGDPQGPVCCVLSCIHAHEYMSIDVIRQVVNVVDPKELSGTILAIPVANTMALSMATRGNWFDGLWGPSGDLGRASPGNPRGWIVERIAHVLTEMVVPRVDVLLDFHGEAPNRRNYIYYPYLRAMETQDQEEIQRYKDYILNLGTDLIVKIKSTGKGSITNQMNGLGKVGIEVEISDFYGFGEDRSSLKRSATEIGLTCVTNTMKKMGMIDGKPKLPSRQVMLDDYAQVAPANGGLMRSEVSRRDLGRILRGGDLIARVFDAFTLEEIEQLKAPFDETMLLAVKEGTPFYHVEPSGCDASGFEVCDWSKAEWVKN
jgi:predicted deacylase